MVLGENIKKTWKIMMQKLPYPPSFLSQLPYFNRRLCKMKDQNNVND
jgi:hypothetical protein